MRHLLLFCILFFSASCANAFSPPTVQVKEDHFVGRYWNPLPDEIVARIKGKSWKENCPIPLADLAYVQVTHWNQAGEELTGELVYHVNLAPEIIEIFHELYDAKFPIEKMILIDDYNADDDLSIEDNNSSAFCFRSKNGRPGVCSPHSYGGTIDINPLLNPYVKETTILPKAAAPYLDRTQNVPGMIKEGDACYNAFMKRGYTWGGHWITSKDYQHFEKMPLE